MKNNVTVYLAKNLSELVYLLKNIPNATMVAGCTRIAYEEKKLYITLPSTSVALRHIPELTLINKTERYIELGSCVTLSQILDLGEKKLPSVLYQAIQTISYPAVRNIATIGGNIASHGIYMTTFAPLLALDAKLEIALAGEIITMPLSKYEGMQSNMCITKIRIPTEEWDIASFIRIGAPHFITALSASYVFLAKTQKDVLLDVRIAFAGSFLFKSRQIENMLIGSTLPLPHKHVGYVLERVNELIKEAPAEAMIKDQFCNILYDSLMSIASP